LKYAFIDLVNQMPLFSLCNLNGGERWKRIMVNIKFHLKKWSLDYWLLVKTESTIPSSLSSSSSPSPLFCNFLVSILEKWSLYSFIKVSAIFCFFLIYFCIKTEIWVTYINIIYNFDTSTTHCDIYMQKRWKPIWPQ